jgi:hypothetical protein
MRSKRKPSRNRKATSELQAQLVSAIDIADNSSKSNVKIASLRPAEESFADVGALVYEKVDHSFKIFNYEEMDGTLLTLLILFVVILVVMLFKSPVSG